jgi:hypothetical protein
MLEKTEHLLARHPFVPFEEIVTLAPASKFSKECSLAHCSFTLFLSVFKIFNQTNGTGQQRGYPAAQG